jgi:hypothetical protein
VGVVVVRRAGDGWSELEEEVAVVNVGPIVPSDEIIFETCS